MKHPKYLASAVGVCSTALLSACGGGGGDSTPAAAPVTAFPLQAGYKARVASGSTDNFAVSGICTGTAVITTAAATAATFEGVPGFAATETVTLNVPNCTPATSAATGTTYYDANYIPLGTSTPGIEYARFLTLPPAFPTSVKPGYTADFATLTTYSDSTKATVTGKLVLSYVIESDTSTTALANFITRGYDAAGQPVFTQQIKYRIAADGTLTTVSIDVQNSTTSTTHLVLTKT